MADPPRCRILELPRELRDLIYDQMFRDTDFQISKTKLPATLPANEQLRDEAMKPFFSLTVFCFQPDPHTAPVAKYVQRISRIPKFQLAFIHRLECREFSSDTTETASEKVDKARMLMVLEWECERAGVVLGAGVLGATVGYWVKDGVFVSYSAERDHGNGVC